MGFSGWPLTVIIIVASLAISAVLIHYGIFFFFLPIIFIPFFRYLSLGDDMRCRKCKSKVSGKYCSNCGARFVARKKRRS